MPLRSKLLTQRWSTLDPPILPFLAPRVFTPWPPSYARKVQPGPRAQRKLHNIAEKPTGEIELNGVIPRRVEADNGLLKEKKTRRAWNLAVPVVHDATETSPEPYVDSAKAQFLKKYEEIWRPPEPVAQEHSRPFLKLSPAPIIQSSSNVFEDAANHNRVEEEPKRAHPSHRRVFLKKKIRKIVTGDPVSFMRPFNGYDHVSYTKARHIYAPPEHLTAESKHENKNLSSTMAMKPRDKEVQSLDVSMPFTTVDRGNPEISLTTSLAGDTILERETVSAFNNIHDPSVGISLVKEHLCEIDAHRRCTYNGAATKPNVDSAMLGSASASKFEKPYPHIASPLRIKRIIRVRRVMIGGEIGGETLRPNRQRGARTGAKAKPTRLLAKYLKEAHSRQRILRSRLHRHMMALGIDERTKFVILPRLRERLIGRYFAVWNPSFAMLDLKNDKFLSRVNTSVAAQPESTSPLLLKLSNWFLKECPSLPAAEEVWQQQTRSVRRALWPELMILALKEHPFKAMRFLVATYSKPYPPGYAVADSIEYIFRKISAIRKQDENAIPPKEFSYTMRLLDRGPKQSSNYLALTQDTIYLLLTGLHHTNLKEFYENLVTHNHPLKRSTLMHFVSRFGKTGQVNMAMDVLKRIKAEGLDCKGPEMASICTTLLQRENRLKDGEPTVSDLNLFEFMLDCGIEPNVVHYNVLMHNTVQSGQPELSWQILDSMTAHGVEPDAYTYSILMNDAKKRNDRSAIHQMWVDVQRRGLRNAYIINELLHSMLLLDMEQRPTGKRNTPGKDTTFGIMLSLYSMHFRLEPLAHLVPVYMDAWADLPRPNSAVSPPLTHIDDNKMVISSKNCSAETTPTTPDLDPWLMEPDHATLMIMMTALVRDLPNPPRDPRPYELRPYATRPYTLRFYEHFQSLLLRDDTAAMDFIRQTKDRMYNLAIMGLGRAHGTLHFCTEVIGNMLAHNQVANHSKQLVAAEKHDQAYPTLKSTPSRSTQAHMNRPKPTIRTWSVLLKCFLDRNQPRAAEKVLQMMASRGMKPDLIVWQTLITGYSRMQDIDKAIDAVDRMEYDGFQPDEITSRSLRWIKNRQVIVQAFMEKKKSQRWAMKFDAKASQAAKDLQLHSRIMKPLKKVLNEAESGPDILGEDKEYALDGVALDQGKTQNLPSKTWMESTTALVHSTSAQGGQDVSQCEQDMEKPQSTVAANAVQNLGETTSVELNLVASNDKTTQSNSDKQHQSIPNNKSEDTKSPLMVHGL